MLYGKNLSPGFVRHEPTVVQIGRRHNARTKERRHRRLCAVEITLSHLNEPCCYTLEIVLSLGCLSPNL